MSTNNPPLSYADAGVSIDSGNALVDAIKPLIAATRRPGADGSIGGFGGVFDLKQTGYDDPLLVAANDGVGTKLKIAIDTDQHATGSDGGRGGCSDYESNQTPSETGNG